jgi:hypothetical protein
LQQEPKRHESLNQFVYGEMLIEHGVDGGSCKFLGGNGAAQARMQREILVGFVERQRNGKVSMQASGCLHDLAFRDSMCMSEFDGDIAEVPNPLMTGEEQFGWSPRFNGLGSR